MRNRLSRRRALVLAGSGIAALAGCIGGSGDDARDDVENGSGDGGNGADAAADDGIPLREHEVPLSYESATFEENAVDGGPDKDGIPSIDDPSFGDRSAGDDMMEPGDPVFGVNIDGDARAYPQHILVSHEIVNDSIGDRNVAVTYCPLTGTAIGFDRGSVEFGVSGMLVNNNLIMYDRETDSWWPQILGSSVRGELTGMSLREFRITWTTWDRWRGEYPDTQVLTEDTGYARNYDRDPYGSYNPRGGYYDNDRNLFKNLNEDDRFPPKAVFIGARSADGAVAFEKDLLRDRRLLEASVGDVPYLAAYDDTLDTAYVYRNSDGTTFEATDGSYEGSGGTHAAAELPLEPVNAFDAMWFAWAGFYPDTVVVA